LTWTLCRRATLSSPLTPSIITLRASSIDAATNANRRLPIIASRCTHSAPARVLPKPRPAIISHTRQPSLDGGSWFLCAQASKSASNASASVGERPEISSHCSSGSIA
jgi:hypothetical protein